MSNDVRKVFTSSKCSSPVDVYTMNLADYSRFHFSIQFTAIIAKCFQLSTTAMITCSMLYVQHAVLYDHVVCYICSMHIYTISTSGRCSWNIT